MKLTESKLRGIIREELIREIAEAGRLDRLAREGAVLDRVEEATGGEIKIVFEHGGDYTGLWVDPSDITMKNLGSGPVSDDWMY